MEFSPSRSTLEILPDELLLEVCKYLLCVDILQSFFGLNSRMTRMITQYRHHVSLHKAYITQSSYLCIHVLPQIGSHIRSLFIDRCYAVLQNELFIKHFGKKMSIMFPNVEKISLVSFRHNHLVAFLDTLNDLNHLVEIDLHGLFDISIDHQASVLRTLLQANNNLLTSILIDDQSTCLSFHDTDCYMNILQLRIKMRTMKELPSLFAAVPNVRYLDVTLEEGDIGSVPFDEMSVSCLIQLTDFRLKCTRRWWELEEVSILLGPLLNVQNLSLFFSTRDKRLVSGNILLPLLPSTVQQFNYAIYYFPGIPVDRDDAIVASWPSSNPITCFCSDTFWFIHTLPWHFVRMPLPPSIGKTISSQKNLEAAFDRRVEQLEIFIDRNFTLTKSLAVIAQCRRMRELIIWATTDGDAVQEEHQPPPPPPPPPSCLPKLFRLIQVQLYASIPVDLDHLSFIFIASPNLFRLDLPFDCLMKLLENHHMCDLLRQRITSLAILTATESSQVTLSEEHIPLIASTLTGLLDLYVDLKNLAPSTTVASTEIMPSSIESMILCLLSEFKHHKLISICADIQPSEKIETDAKQWLKDSSTLCGQQFDASFSEELKRLVIWM